MPNVGRDYKRLHERPLLQLVDWVIRQIEMGSLEEIRKLFENISIEKLVKILDFKIHGCTPLFVALRKNNVEIARYLFELYLNQGREKMHQSWKSGRHPLKGAIASNNIELIQLILHNMEDINDNVYGSHTPLMLGILSNNYEAVKLMVAMEADINRTGVLGFTPLMASVSNNKICLYLIEKDAHLNHQDDDGNTALHHAIYQKQLSSIATLVNLGSNLNIWNREGLTPLMCAAVTMNYTTITFLSQHSAYSELDHIEALEVYNACTLGAQQPSVEQWIHTLRLRRYAYPKRQPLYTMKMLLCFAKEFTSMHELFAIKNSPLHLALQAILVIERIFGRNCVYLRLLLQTTLIAKKEKNIWKTRELVEFIKKYSCVTPASSVAVCSQSFRNLFTELKDSVYVYPNGKFTLFEIIATATGTLWGVINKRYLNAAHFKHGPYSELVDTVLYMTAKLKSQSLSPDYQNKFNSVVKKLVELDPRVSCRQPLLHRAIKWGKTHPGDLVGLIRALVESGADVDAEDYFRQTPLKYAMKHLPDDMLKEIISLLG